MVSTTRKVLMISPHFPPDTSAATHRVRLLAPHLGAYGWTPTVLTVKPEYYEGRLDEDLSALVPHSVRVERCDALPARWTRAFGVGDLGLRSGPFLYSAAARLLAAETYSALFITIYPTYPATFGPRLKRRFGIPFVLDYQDPWVSEWGQSVGSRPGGRPDLKSRFTRALATYAEPRTARHADAITAVSAETYMQVLRKIPVSAGRPVAEIPLGGDPADFEAVRGRGKANRFFAQNDGLFHLCHVGTILPLGIETLRAFLTAVSTLKTERPELYARLRIYFFGSGNQTAENTRPVVMGHASDIGVADCIREHPARVDYLEALAIQSDASGLVLLGSTERHYTASRLYPALLSNTPIIAAYHAESSVNAIIRSSERHDVRGVQFDDKSRPAAHSGELLANLIDLMEAGPQRRSSGGERRSLGEYEARALAGRLAAVFDEVAR